METPKSKSKLLAAFWPLLQIGRAFVGLPVRLEKNRLTFQGSWPFSPYKSFLFLYTVFIWSSLTVVAIFAFIICVRETKSLADVNSVEQLYDLCYHVHLALTSTFCIYKSKQFPLIFETWKKVNAGLQKYEFARSWLAFTSTSEQKFIFKCWLMTGIYMLSILIGAVTYFAIVIGIKDDPHSFQEFLDRACVIYVLEEACWWWSGYYIILIGIVMEISWAYGDILILLFSYAMRHECDRFNAILRRKRSTSASIHEIEALRQLHSKIVEWIDRTDEILGPIITISLTCDVLYLFCFVYIGFEESPALRNAWTIAFDDVYPVAYLVSRIFASTIMAVRLAEVKLETIAILVEISWQQHEETYLLLVDRFVQQVQCSGMGLSASGYIALNRAFVKGLISALISFQVIILQSAIASAGAITVSAVDSATSRSHHTK